MASNVSRLTMDDELIAQQWLEGMPFFFQEIVQLTNKATNRDIHVHFRTYRGAQHLMFKSVPDKFRSSAALTSSLGVAITIYIDYWADTVPRRDLIEQAYAHMLTGTSIPENSKINALPEMWRKYLETIKAAPLVATFFEYLMETWRHLFDAMFYSLFINNTDDYLPTYSIALNRSSGNMLGTHKHIIDMCFSPHWRSEWTQLAFELAEKMTHIVRIGNCLKSWRQEIALHRDISSTVCAIALEHKVVDRKSFKSEDPHVIIRQIETTPIPALGSLTALEFLRKEVLRYFSEIEGMDVSGFVDIANYVNSLKLVLQEQLKGASENR